MNNTFENLSYITLYKTPMFNKTDTLFFESATDRDTYFNSVSDQVTITDYTDLYENRVLYLPYNYLDLKKYNTMKLHYDDSLGHVEDYYCNVDNYIYVSTECCSPIYRIDYFLTFGHLLKNKQLGMITDRRTVAEKNITKNMKADELVVPRIKYERYSSYGSDTEEINYIIYLNKTTNNQGKKGINCDMGIYLGYADDGTDIYYHIDTYTIGCYVVVANQSKLSTILNNEPLEYIEKIIESNVPPTIYLSGFDISNYNNNGYVYVSNDTRQLSNTNYCTKINYKNANFAFDYSELENIYPTHNKKVMEWLPTKGIVIQGNEFDLKDFDDTDFPSDSRVTSKHKELYSSIYMFNLFGYTFAYPLGYKGEEISRDYMVQWQSGRNFTYTLDYTKSLAYKELLESNNQASYYAIKNAALNTYYAQQLLANQNAQLDITKSQSILSYQSQINNLNTNSNNITAKTTGTSGVLNTISGFVGDLFNVGLGSALSRAFSAPSETKVNVNNLILYGSQINNLRQQSNNANDLIDLQKRANQINTNFQCDTIALARDNALANISISNKYNNAKPNAYNSTDFTQFTAYYYIFEIDTDDSSDYSHVVNLRNHYNVLGTYVGYYELWDTNNSEGIYFDYIKGSIINNSNYLSENISYDVYLELVARIEDGVRLWKQTAINWFGNLTLDNTYTDVLIPEYYNTLTESRKNELEDIYYNIAYSGKTKDETFVELNTLTLTLEEFNYLSWFHNIVPWGVTIDEITFIRKNKIRSLCGSFLIETSQDKNKSIKLLEEQNYLTIYEKQYGITYINNL